MANLNLSQFTEKTFVADADWTFVWDTAGLISKKVSRNSLLNSGTLTTSAPVTISQTWADVAQTFKALVVNAAGTSDANSASGSLLLDLQVNGVSKVSIDKAGGIVCAGITNSGIILADANKVGLRNGGVTIGDAGALSWSISGTAGATRDLFVVKDGANTLALRNGAAAQTFNVYGTYTSATTNFERLAIKYNATDVAYQIAAEKGSTNGDYRPLDFVTGGSRRMTIGTTGNVGIGTTAPSSKLQVSAGDVEVDTIAKGVILKSPDGTRYRVTVANGGTLSVAAV
jgi:hypothetical protein